MSEDRRYCLRTTLLHGSVAGRSRPPAFAFMRDEGTLAARARACGSARRQQWPPRSSAALWCASAEQVCVRRDIVKAPAMRPVPLGHGATERAEIGWRLSRIERDPIGCL